MVFACSPYHSRHSANVSTSVTSVSGGQHQEEGRGGYPDRGALVFPTPPKPGKQRNDQRPSASIGLAISSRRDAGTTLVAAGRTSCQGPGPWTAPKSPSAGPQRRWRRRMRARVRMATSVALVVYLYMYACPMHACTRVCTYRRRWRTWRAPMAGRMKQGMMRGQKYGVQGPGSRAGGAYSSGWLMKRGSAEYTLVRRSHMTCTYICVRACILYEPRMCICAHVCMHACMHA